MRRRIAVLITGAFAAHGGVQLVNRNIALALSGHPGFDPEFFSLTDTGADPRYLREAPFRGFAGKRAHFARGVARAFLTRGYSAMLITHRNLYPAAWFWKAVVRRPYLLWAHGIELWDRQKPWYRIPLLAAQKVLTSSQYTRERMCGANGLPLSRAETVPLCLDQIRMPPEIPAAPPSTDPLLLTVARSVGQEGYKGQDTVIKALPQILAKYPTARYILAGGGDDQPRMRALADSMGVSGSVELLGEISDIERNTLFQRASVFLMPSRGEGFGLVYLEAMNFHLPCIAGNGDGGQEVVRNGVNGFTVDPRNPQEVAAATLRLLDDPKLRSAMGDAGYNLRRTVFSFESFSNSLCAALEQAVDAR